MIPATPDSTLSIALFAIFGIVLFGPFLIKKIEHNLEVFLFVMGAMAVTLDTFLLTVTPSAAPKSHELLPNWNLSLVEKALVDPIEITLAVLLVGLLFHYGRNKVKSAVEYILKKIPVRVFVGFSVILLGLLSSVITAIIAALLLAELIGILKLNRKREITIVIVACFAIGLGAALTPVGEPLSTIVIRTKLEENFWFLLYQIGKYVIPGVLALGIFSMFLAGSRTEEPPPSLEEKGTDKLKDVGIRGLKVYIFVMALVLLGTGFYPITKWYIEPLSPQLLYWANSVSAILDNATLAAAEISKEMTILQLDSALMALLIAGGMLIPGNIPNIIAANKLKITSKEWAKLGVPLGAVLMAIYFVILFVVKV